MKPFEELTRLGRLRRMRGLAQTALEAFGMPEARFKLVLQAGNTLFRVHAPDLAGLETPDGELFEPGQYLLRLHQPGYQDPDAVRLELAWLAAMRREANLPVPEPVPALDGQLLLAVNQPGIPGTRHCSLLRWVKGRLLKKRFRPHHLRLQGQLMARLHNFSTQWQPPAGLSKRKFDWEGLFQNDVGSGMPNAEAWGLLAPADRENFSLVAQRVKEVMDAWGQGSDFYGLIHGDLAADANLLFWHGTPRAIDFDDSGYGYWVFDLAVALDACWGDPAYPRFRQALLEGYTEHHPLHQEQAEHLELFVAALQVYWDLWATGGTHLYPHLRPEYAERMQRAAALVRHYVRTEARA